MPDADRILRIDLSSSVPTYRQISDGLRALLVSGSFKPGDQLPTVRQLAIDLGVHHNTVAEAYRLLADEGWLELKRRRGAVMLPRPVPSPRPNAEASLAQRLREVASEAIARGLPSALVRDTLARIATELPGDPS